MSDQANNLRRRMFGQAASDASHRPIAPRWIAVAGGNGGVGTTTIAIQLALACKRQKTLLIDADPRGGDAALLFDVDDRYTLSDLLAGRRQIAEVAQKTTDGLYVVPGACDWDDSSGSGVVSLDRIHERLEGGFGNSEPVDTVVFDLGVGRSRTICRLWQAADVAVMVISETANGVVAAHRAIQTLTKRGQARRICLFANRVSTPENGASVYRRLAQAGRRFLGIHLEDAGCLPVAPFDAMKPVNDRQARMRFFADATRDLCEIVLRRDRANVKSETRKEGCSVFENSAPTGPLCYSK
jgi:flagellar biosynthesis protein FlhG